jgi:hypothetical protein
VAANNHYAVFGPATANSHRKMFGLKEVVCEELNQKRLRRRFLKVKKEEELRLCRIYSIFQPVISLSYNMIGIVEMGQNGWDNTFV